MVNSADHLGAGDDDEGKFAKQGGKNKLLSEFTLIVNTCSGSWQEGPKSCYRCGWES